MTTQTLPLNLIPKGVCPRLYVSQYDKGQEWNFDIYAGTEAYTIPSGASVKIQGTKPDKTGFQYACSFSGNRVTATEQQQMTIIAGDVPAEIRIEKNNEIIATLNFIIAVEKAALADDTVISETDLPLIEEAIEVLGHADELVQRIEGDVTTSGNNALKAEGFAVGQQNGSDVASGSPYYHNSAKYYKEQAADSASTASNKASDASGSASAASGSASSASTNALKAEGFAVGQQNGSDVASGSPYYHNSAKYYKEQAADSASTASTKAGEAAASAQAAAQSAAHLTIDNAMSTTSENALQNKVITTTIQNLSNNLKNNGSKNLYPSHPVGYSLTYATVTAKWEENGIVDIDGTSTGYAIFTELASQPIDGCVDGQQYVLSGCPSGGATNKYLIYVYDVTAGGYAAQDIGSGAEFTYHSDHVYNLAMYVVNGTTVSHLKFKPMICLKSDYDLDPSYEPYAMTNQLLTKETTGLIDNTTQLGCVNQLSLDLTTIKSLNTSGSWSGNVYTLNEVSFTVNDNGTVTVNASSTPSSNRRFVIMSASDVEALRQKLGGTMRVTGCPSGGAGSKYNIYTHYKNTSEYPGDIGEGMDYVKEIDQPLQIQVMSGYAISNQLFKPMISLPSMNLTYNDYVPYSKSNKELTEDISSINSDISAINNAKIGKGIMIRISNESGAWGVWGQGKFGSTTTLQDILTYLKTNTVKADMVFIYTNANSSAFNQSLPVASGSAVEIVGTGYAGSYGYWDRGYVRVVNYSNGQVYYAGFVNNTLTTWKTVTMT